MKKLIVLLVFLSIICPVFAQNVYNSDGSDKNMYYHNVFVERVYPSNTGYIVQYRKGVNEIGTIGIPNEWFTDADSKAELLKLQPGQDWPTMSVFYKDGVFNHVRLYVHRQKSHITWGYVPQGTDVSRFFTDSDSFKLDY